MTWFLGTVVVLLSAALMFLLALMLYLDSRQRAEVKDARHHECIDIITDVVRGSRDAVLIRQLADKWDSTETQNIIAAIRSEYRPDGPSVPAIWLRQQADMCEPLLEPSGRG